DYYYNITEMYMELAINSSFDLFINGNYSGNYSPQYSDDMRASKWYLNESYYDNFQFGMNLFDFDFGDTLGYIGGGFLRMDTFSNQTNLTDIEYNGVNVTKREYFPGIDGILNLYSSFYVPGDLDSLKFHLHFKSLDNTTLTVGSTNVYSEQGSGEMTVDLDDSNLTALNYSDLSEKTIPLRFRLEGSDFLGPGVDSLLVTDVSGSMDDCSGVYYNATICKYEYCTFYFFGCWNWDWIECEYTGSCSDDECDSGTSRTRNHDVENGSLCKSKLQVAQEADKDFVDTLLNNSNNNIGLASYNANLDEFTDLTKDQALLNDAIDNYTAGGGTCICCGIYKAVDMLPSYRKRYIVVISDGDANYKCSGPGDYTGTSDSTNAPQSTIDAGQYACNNESITVYTIGFGQGISPQGTQTLIDTACNESLYYNATDTSMLAEVIKNISLQILKTSFEFQTAFSNYTNSTLYNDSYVEFVYDPATPPVVFGKIPFTTEGPVTGNNVSDGYFDVLENVTVIDARVTSYSGNKWTNRLSINNSIYNTTVYNLTEYGNYYIGLGDPFHVNIPVNYVKEGINNYSVRTGTSASNSTGGSQDDRAIYTFLVKTTQGYSALGSYARGCTWEVQFEDDSNSTIDVPTGYSGNETCYYKNATYDSDDSLDLAFYNILDHYDLDDDGKVDIYIGDDSIKAEQITMEKVPSLWGPALVEVRIWQ
ncbi:VWA domain-containing protein, partial [Candidatus Woesearchaeota archaeon]|nr:VWA domain-containing protein [Candidatus Woesearchaeota archaeon]